MRYERAGDVVCLAFKEATAGWPAKISRRSSP